MTNECATSPSQHLSTFITSLFPGFLAHGIVGTVVVGRAQVEVDGLVLAPGWLFLCDFDQTSKILSSSLKWE